MIEVCYGNPIAASFEAPIPSEYYLPHESFFIRLCYFYLQKQEKDFLKNSLITTIT